MGKMYEQLDIPEQYCASIEFYGFDPAKEEWSYVISAPLWERYFETEQEARKELEQLEVKPLGTIAWYLHYKYPHLSDIDAEYKLEQLREKGGNTFEEWVNLSIFATDEWQEG